MRDRGYTVRVLRPADLTQSLRFNPLYYYHSLQQLRQLSTILSQNAGDASKDSFWIISARNLLYWSLAALRQVENPVYHNLANLRWILNHMGGVDERGIHRFMAQYLDDDQLFSEFLAFLAQDSRVLASVLSSARACLELWSDPCICRLTASNNIDLSALRKEPTVIYLVVPEHRIKYFSLILNLFYSACFAQCLEHGEGLPVYFLLDEFGNLGRINEFAGIITTLRKRRCSISIILQELSQLTAIYGQHEGRTIYSGGSANKLFYSGLDLETTRYVEGLLGHNTV
jgi:type IV secretory pathway TraG/TraD family ATPase VirD4